MYDEALMYNDANLQPVNHTDCWIPNGMWPLPPTVFTQCPKVERLDSRPKYKIDFYFLALIKRPRFDARGGRKLLWLYWSRFIHSNCAGLMVQIYLGFNSLQYHLFYLFVGLLEVEFCSDINPCDVHVHVDTCSV